MKGLRPSKGKKEEKRGWNSLGGTEGDRTGKGEEWRKSVERPAGEEDGRRGRAGRGEWCGRDMRGRER